MFSRYMYKYLIVSLVFSTSVFWSGNPFLIAPFPDLCLLVPFCILHGPVFVMYVADCFQPGKTLVQATMHLLDMDCFPMLTLFSEINVARRY